MLVLLFENLAPISADTSSVLCSKTNCASLVQSVLVQSDIIGLRTSHISLCREPETVSSCFFSCWFVELLVSFVQHVIIGLDTKEILSEMELSGPATIDFGIEEIEEEEESDFDEDKEEGDDDEDDEFEGVGIIGSFVPSIQ